MLKSPWHWVPSLFAAEEIPASIVTYVAVLMFLQTDTPPAMATCYCGLLFLPWVLKSFLRSYVRRLGYFRRQLQWLELAIVGFLMLLAFSFVGGPFFIFLSLFLLSFLTAWHELAARMYYERMLWPRQQYYFNLPKMLASQSAVVLTYGVLIMLVGALQVIHRRIAHSWTEGCYLMAGVFLMFALYHVFVLRRPGVADTRQRGTALDAVRDEIRIIDRIRRKPHWLLVVVALFLLLLPQGLMFFSRVLFLLTPKSAGGLGCTIQEVGFAQGTIGVVAFSLGLFLGRQLLHLSRGHSAHLLWYYIIPLGLSPVVYVLMVIEPPSSLMQLCVATFQAQLFFGFGLNGTIHFVRYISGERYRNTINYLYIPLVASVMLPGMAISGWLVGEMGFFHFFIVDALTAPVAWTFVSLARLTKITI